MTETLTRTVLTPMILLLTGLETGVSKAWGNGLPIVARRPAKEAAL